MMNKFEVKNMDLYYGSFHALKNINIAIPEKEITAFIGPSGCGKSTFLKSLNRMNDLVVEPEVLLMDEPTSALDPISTSKVEELALELKDRYTIVIVTHNMQQAARISDKTAFFLLGELVEMGDTERLFSTPVDKRTEDYISGRFG